jgi:hypothetical protein
MATRMVTLHLEPVDATPEKVRAKLGLAKGDLDENFGVATIDPTKKLFAIVVSEQTAARIEGAPAVSGAFSGPRIDTLGPVR